MAKPRIFISSTFYDLKSLRVDLDKFIRDFNYEPIRNEVGEIPYGVEDNLEEYCYKEVHDVDMLLGIIGNRYGSESKQTQYSITQLEIKTAVEQGKQVYLFIEKNVRTEYETYLLNKEKEIAFKYVDSVKIYEFIEEVMKLTGGIIIHPFEHVSDITAFLKNQWAGLFKDFLRQNSQKKQYENLTHKINDLSAVTATLKTYLEKALPRVLEGENVVKIIEEENKKLEAEKQLSQLLELEGIKHLVNTHNIAIEKIKTGLLTSETLFDFINFLKEQNSNRGDISFRCMTTGIRMNDINMARILLGKTTFKDNREELRAKLPRIEGSPTLKFSIKQPVGISKNSDAETAKKPIKKSASK
ncbi:MAG: DUF4062 domain-containing protein [Mucilaginibacter sp.]